MANARTRKREIDKAKRERAANKREKRQERLTEDEAAAAETAGPTSSQPNEGGVLAALEALHQRYDAEQISFEEFEEARTELLSRLNVT